MDHVHTEPDQQYEGDPVIPFEDETAGRLADQPADDRRDGLDGAEDHPGTQGFGKARFVQTRTLADGSGEGIRRHGEGQKQ